MEGPRFEGVDGKPVFIAVLTSLPIYWAKQSKLKQKSLTQYIIYPTTN